MTKVVHIKREPYDVRIDRASPWGNPFVIGQDGNRDEVIAKYRDWVLNSLDGQGRWIRENVHLLKDQTLACWCHPSDCHGNFLAALADA